MTATTARAPFAGPSLWVPGDWKAFFGFGANASAVGLDKLGENGVLHHGLAVLGAGATLAGIVLGSVTVMLIEAIILYACARRAFIVPLGTVAHEEPAL